MTQDSLRNWLAGEKADAILRRAATSVLREITSRSIAVTGIAHSGPSSVGNADSLEEIRQELACFILQKRKLFEKVLGSNDAGAHILLKTAFIHHVISLSRRPDRDPLRYLYKRVSGVLRDSDAFFIRAVRRKPMLYSMDSESLQVMPLADEDRGRIAPLDPALQLPANGRFRKGLLLGLAGHFWRELSTIYGNRPVWVSVSDLVGWIGSLAALPAYRRTVYLADGAQDADNLPDPRQAPYASFFDPALVREWAGRFVESLGGEEKAAFYLRHGASLPLGKIAVKLGYKGPSGPGYRIAWAEKKLRCFLRDLPWLSPDDLNEEAFSLFCETLLSILKKQVSGT